MRVRLIPSSASGYDVPPTDQSLILALSRDPGHILRKGESCVIIKKHYFISITL